jgi:hypothetical protein
MYSKHYNSDFCPRTLVTVLQVVYMAARVTITRLRTVINFCMYSFEFDTYNKMIFEMLNCLYVTEICFLSLYTVQQIHAKVEDKMYLCLGKWYTSFYDS